MQTILVVEDDHNIRVSLRQALEAHGYYVFSAANGVDGLAMLMRIKRPTVILLDWLLPLMGGKEFLQAKMKDENLANIPVIVISAVAHEIKETGINELLPKPIDLNQLIKTIKKYCDEPC